MTAFSYTYKDKGKPQVLSIDIRSSSYFYQLVDAKDMSHIPINIPDFQ